MKKVRDRRSDFSPSEALSLHIQRQQALCDALEDVADNLPTAVDKLKCLQLSQSIWPIIKSAHTFEEEEVFPILALKTEAAVDLQQAMERLHYEHWEDESFGQDLADTMRAFAAGDDQDAEKLSYMLRGFFEGLRRHLAFESEVLTPMLKSDLQ